MAFTYQLGIVGGTFDRLHLGHQTLLDAAFDASENVIVGVATSKLYQHKSFSTIIEDFKTREDAVISYLTDKEYIDRATIIPIDDIYGNSLTEKDIEAIFVTEGNNANVQTINEEREHRGLAPLHIVHVDYSLGNDGEVITSERIRKGEIDRDGNAYALLFAKKESYMLPYEGREILRKPFGNVYTDVSEIVEQYRDAMIIAVGDVVSLSLYKKDKQAAISIVDLKTRRNTLQESDIDIFYAMPSLKAAKNEAGSIEHNAVERIQESLKTFENLGENQTIVVAGEEDLLTIPAILLAPLSAVVVYGQFDKGAIAVEVTESKKREIADIFRMFT